MTSTHFTGVLHNYVIIVLLIMTSLTSAQLFTYGTSAGDATLTRSNDGCSDLQNVRFSFRFFGTNYNAIYVCTNGILSFNGAVTSTTNTPFPVTSFPVLAAYYGDVDSSRGVGNVYYRQARSGDSLITDVTSALQDADCSFGDAVQAYIVTWYGVPENAGYWWRPRSTFQLVLITDQTSTYVVYNYQSLSWTPAQVGFDGGDGVHFYQIQASSSSGITSLSSCSNVGVTGRWVFQVDGRNIDTCGASEPTPTPTPEPEEPCHEESDSSDSESESDCGSNSGQSNSCPFTISASQIEEPIETTVVDTTLEETTMPDTTIPETTIPETKFPETTVPETTVPETTIPETTIPETTVPETTIPVTTIPETTVPETTIPETTVPETTVPKTTIPETTIPETTNPETTIPETTVPETTIPETTIPETTVPETTIPETTVPETTIPETTVPETTIPETTVPVTTIPETTVPETTFPEKTIPETTIPETNIPETGGQATTTNLPFSTTESETTIAETTIAEQTTGRTTTPASDSGGGLVIVIGEIQTPNNNRQGEVDPGSEDTNTQSNMAVNVDVTTRDSVSLTTERQVSATIIATTVLANSAQAQQSNQGQTQRSEVVDMEILPYIVVAVAVILISLAGAFIGYMVATKKSSAAPVVAPTSQSTPLQEIVVPLPRRNNYFRLQRKTPLMSV